LDAAFGDELGQIGGDVRKIAEGAGPGGDDGAGDKLIGGLAGAATGVVGVDHLASTLDIVPLGNRGLADQGMALVHGKYLSRFEARGP